MLSFKRNESYKKTKTPAHNDFSSVDHSIIDHCYEKVTVNPHGGSREYDLLNYNRTSTSSLMSKKASESSSIHNRTSASFLTFHNNAIATEEITNTLETSDENDADDYSKLDLTARKKPQPEPIEIVKPSD